MRNGGWDFAAYDSVTYHSSSPLDHHHHHHHHRPPHPRLHDFKRELQSSAVHQPIVIPRRALPPNVPIPAYTFVYDARHSHTIVIVLACVIPQCLSISSTDWLYTHGIASTGLWDQLRLHQHERQWPQFISDWMRTAAFRCFANNGTDENMTLTMISVSMVLDVDWQETDEHERKL